MGKTLKTSLCHFFWHRRWCHNFDQCIFLSGVAFGDFKL